MSDVPDDLRYTVEHEWVRVEKDGLLTVGITDYAQESLGDVTFVELPQKGSRFAAGAIFGVVESVKAASDLFLPVTGEVISVNDALEAEPEKVNQDPYGEGWMVTIRVTDPDAVSSLLNAEQYSAGL